MTICIKNKNFLPIALLKKINILLVTVKNK